MSASIMQVRQYHVCGRWSPQLISEFFGKDAPWVTHCGRRGRRSEEGGDAAAERSSYHNDDQRKRRRGMHAAYRKDAYTVVGTVRTPKYAGTYGLPVPDSDATENERKNPTGS